MAKKYENMTTEEQVKMLDVYDKAMEVAEIVMGRRGIELDKRERSILKHIFDTSAEYRTWEK